MTDKRRGLGRGLGALIPNGTAAVTKPVGDRPVDVFFPGQPNGQTSGQANGQVSEQGDDDAGTGGTATIADTDAIEQLERVLAADEPTSVGDSKDGGDDGGSRGDGGDDVGGGDGAMTTPAGAAEDLVPVPGLRFAELPVAHVHPNPRQPRQVFDEDALAELVHSVREIGVLQPVVVRPAGADEQGTQRYELVMGERRWRAVQEAGLDTIPAIVRETSDDVLLRDALLENLHRADLNALEEAAAYQQLLDDFGCTHEELAGRIGRSRPQISNTLRLLKLPPTVQRRVAAGVLSAGHARALLGLEDSASMERLADRIVGEGLSVRAVEEIVALGDDPAKPVRKRPRPGGHTPELNDLASRLGDRFDTRVTVALGRTKGRLSIDFASVDDLNRIIALMAPEVRQAFGQP